MGNIISIWKWEGFFIITMVTQGYAGYFVSKRTILCRTTHVCFEPIIFVLIVVLIVVDYIIVTPSLLESAWRRHQMETFSALLALCAGNSPVLMNSPHKGQWRGALMFYLICVWINGWVNNREAGDINDFNLKCVAIVIILIDIFVCIFYYVCSVKHPYLLEKSVDRLYIQAPVMGLLTQGNL